VRIDADLVRRDPALARAATPRLTSYIPHRPTPRQAAFLVLSCKEAFYGGAAGGGKSDALLMGGLQFVDVAGYAAVIVRESYQTLAQPGGLMARAEQWLSGTDAVWNSSDHQWRFPSGATLTFRHLQDAGAHRAFQGAEYSYIGVDEVTDFAEEQYRFLFSRLRRGADAKVPLRMRAASNPYGPGQEWCYRRFILAAGRSGRVFIPARLEDNPYLDRDAYERSLKELGPIAYRQLRHGDWTVRPHGGLFQEEWFTDRLVEREAVPRSASLCRYWDLGSTEAAPGKDPDYTAGVLLACSGALWYVVDVKRTRSSPHGVESLVRASAEEDRAWAQGREMGAPAIRIEQEPGSAGVAVIAHYRQRVLTPFDMAGVRSTGSKETRAGPLASRCEAGEVRVCEGAWNTEFLDEVVAFPAGAHDDQVDAFSGAFNHLAERMSIEFAPAPISLTKPSYWRTGFGGENRYSMDYRG
jgi:predicted phage terminase large subunit-like protein